jgi:hypothetical protein
VKIYQRRLDDLDFQGYNPFGSVNIMQNRVYLFPKPEELRTHLLRRGMLFVDGKKLEQVELYKELAQKDGRFWCEHDGLTIPLSQKSRASPLVATQTKPSRVHLLRWHYLVALSRKPSRSLPASETVPI